MAPPQPLKPAAPQPDTAHQHAKVQAHLEQSRDHFLRTVEIAAGRHAVDNPAKNEVIDQAIFADIAKVYKELHPKLVNENVKAYQTAQTPTDLKRLQSEIKHKYAAELATAIKKKYPEKGEEALIAVSQEMIPESYLTPLAQTVYHSDGGGIQWGGLIGLAVSLLAGYKASSMLTASMGEGALATIVTVVGTLAVGAAGAYAAHKCIDPKPQLLHTPDFRTSNKSPATPGKVVAVETTAPTRDFAALLDTTPLAPSAEADVRSMGVKGDVKAQGAFSPS